MKNRFPTRLGKIALCLSMAAALAACGHSAPSEGDAKAAINARLGDCEYFKITDFEKVNGRQLDDTDYRVDVKYAITMSPTSATKKQVDAWKADDAKYQDIETQLKAVQQTAGTFSEQAKALSGDAYTVQQQALRESNPYNLLQNVVSECPRVQRSVTNQFFGGHTKMTAYSDDISYTFTEELWMVKTDNGWQEAR